jgi:Ca-activated chloride channel family protein
MLRAVIRFLGPAAAALTLFVSVPAAQFRSTSNLVVLNVRVTDDNGQHVRGLTERSFAVYEDGKPQTVSLFADEDAPATVGLIIDSSVSMLAISDRVIAGATAFAAENHPDNDLFALAFNEQRWPALDVRAPFTSDAEVLRAGLQRVVSPRGRTALFDAINAGLAYAERGRHPRKALVVLSDGGDNASSATFEDVVQRTQSSNTVIYGVALVDPVGDGARPEVLRRLARSTGGEALSPRDVDDVQSALGRVAQDIRRSYTLGYVPAGSNPGARHTLRVAATGPDRKRLRVRTREEYREAAAEAPEAAEPASLAPADAPRHEAGPPHGATEVVIP